MGFCSKSKLLARVDDREKVSMPTAVYDLITNYSRIILVAGSIDAYFCMNARIDDFIESAYFISPIVNFERLIVDMISWAATSEKELEKRKVILVDFGDDLSWDYLGYVRNHAIHWNVPT